MSRPTPAERVARAKYERTRGVLLEVDCPDCAGDGGWLADASMDPSDGRELWHDCATCAGFGAVSRAYLAEEDQP